MDTKGLHELFYAFWDAGVMLSFGRDCITNIPRHSDSDDTGWHLMFRDMSLFKGQMNVFHRIVEERGLKVKREVHLGFTYISIYRPGYRAPPDKHGPLASMEIT